MSQANEKPNTTIKIPADIKVFEDKKTGVKTMAVQFVFPDYANGVLSLTRLSRFPWVPGQVIDSVTINFKDKDEDKTP